MEKNKIRFCTNCGFELPEGCKQCPNCKKNVEELSVQHTKNEGKVKNTKTYDKESENKKKMPFWSKGWFIIATFIMCFPIGLILMWKYKKFNKPVRIGISGIYAFLFALSLIGSNSESLNTKAAPTVLAESAVQTTIEPETTAAETSEAELIITKTTEPESTAEVNTEENRESETVSKEDKENLENAIQDYLNNTNSKKALKLIKKSDRDLVWEILSAKVLETLQEDSKEYYLGDIRKYNQLYEEAFSESRPEWDESIELIEQIDSLKDKKRKLKEKYPFNLEDGALGYQYADVYVDRILETAYESNILGMIQKEIDSYKEKEGSSWVAYNVIYNEFLGQVPGEEMYILYSTQVSPFSKSGVYNIAYYSNGKTITTTNSKGFQNERPVLYLIDDMQLNEDWEEYQNYESQSRQLLSEIEKLNGGTGSINKIEHTEKQLVDNNEGLALIPISEIINTKWAKTPYEEYSFYLRSDGPNSIVFELIETGNPDNVYYRGWSKTITATEMCDLYITFGGGESEEFAISWYNRESLDYPILEALNDVFEEYAGDYYYLGILD